MYNILLISIGSIFGALLRWLISSKFNYLEIYNVESFPFGTLFVNLIGCYIIGLLAFIFVNQELKLLFIVGFLGSFTTFSTFSLESLEFLKNQKFTLFFIQYFLNSLGAIIMTILGYLSFIYLKKFITLNIVHHKMN